MTRKVIFGNGEHYHIYNRGVDRRNIFVDQNDTSRFLWSMQAFNTINPIGSLRDLPRDPISGGGRLVEFVAHHLLPNHYHFILEQVVDDGISHFMQRLGIGYTLYFNEKHHRSGSLFQGRYKAEHIDTNEYLLYGSAYVNRNDRVHAVVGESMILTHSSWGQYMGKEGGFCKPDIVLEQFPNTEAYAKFCEQALPTMLERKEKDRELRKFFLE